MWFEEQHHYKKTLEDYSGQRSTRQTCMNSDESVDSLLRLKFRIIIIYTVINTKPNQQQILRLKKGGRHTYIVGDRH